MQLSLLDWLQRQEGFSKEASDMALLGIQLGLVAGALALPMETETSVIFHLRNLTLVCVREREKRAREGDTLIYIVYLSLFTP